MLGGLKPGTVQAMPFRAFPAPPARSALSTLGAAALGSHPCRFILLPARIGEDGGQQVPRRTRQSLDA